MDGVLVLVLMYICVTRLHYTVLGLNNCLKISAIVTPSVSQ